MVPMGHVVFDDISVDFEVEGTGEQVVLVHARPFVSWYGPLVAALPDHSVLWYRRTVSPDRAALSLADDADVCARLLQHVGFEHPHVVGHSYGGCLALELARRDDVAPRSIALLEPAPSGLAEPVDAFGAMAPLEELVRSDGSAVAIERFLQLVVGDDAVARLDRLVPAARQDALDHGDQFFRFELPALARWTFGPDDARRIDEPVLNVLGAASVERFVHGAEIIQRWFPHASRYVLPGTGHLLMAQDPAPIARRLEAFWSASDTMSP